MMFFSGWRGVFAVMAAGMLLFCPGAAFSQITTCEVVAAHGVPDAADVAALTADAEKGMAKAQYGLGCLYRWGKGVKKDFRLALEWFMKAADQDDPAARHEIADMYRHSQGFQGQMKQAVSEVEQQAKEGDARAQYSLGMMYVNGLGMDRDDKEALFWYEKSAAQGNVDAGARLAGMYARGQGVKQDYARAFELGREAADQGHVMSMLNLGRMYETGTGVPQDIEQARSYYRQASEKGNRVAAALLKHLEGGGKIPAAPPMTEAAAATGGISGETAAGEKPLTAEGDGMPKVTQAAPETAPEAAVMQEQAPQKNRLRKRRQ